MANTIIKKTKQYVETEAAVEKMIVWSDGCSAQYKSKMPFFHCANSTIERAYFGSRHAKSPCDACGGVVKAVVDDDVRSENLTIQNAKQMFDHLQQNVSLPEVPVEPGTCCHVKRSFHLVTSHEIECTVLTLNAISSSSSKRQHGKQKQLNGKASEKTSGNSTKDGSK